MQIQIRFREIPLTADARARFERQVRLALGRLGGDRGPVSRVRVAVAGAECPGDAPGAPKRADVRCRVLVSFGPHAAIEVDERAPQIDVAVQRALARATRAVERRLP
jgi:hypothetical protein